MRATRNGGDTSPPHADRSFLKEEVLDEFGLTAEDFDRMEYTPLEPQPNHPGQ